MEVRIKLSKKDMYSTVRTEPDKLTFHKEKLLLNTSKFSKQMDRTRKNFLCWSVCYLTFWLLLVHAVPFQVSCFFFLYLAAVCKLRFKTFCAFPLCLGKRRRCCLAVLPFRRRRWPRSCGFAAAADTPKAFSFGPVFVI